jgi:hypothetical protein
VNKLWAKLFALLSLKNHVALSYFQGSTSSFYHINTGFMDLRWVISKVGYCPPDNLRWVISKVSTRLNIPIYPYKNWVYGLALGYFHKESIPFSK